MASPSLIPSKVFTNFLYLPKKKRKCAYYGITIINPQSKFDLHPHWILPWSEVVDANYRMPRMLRMLRILFQELFVANFGFCLVSTFVPGLRLLWSRRRDLYCGGHTVVVVLAVALLILFGFTDMEKAAAMADIISVLFDIQDVLIFVLLLCHTKQPIAAKKKTPKEAFKM